jgi:hypothetical protein
LLADEKLSLILKLAPTLAVDGALTRTWPRKVNFNPAENLSGLLEALPLLVTPAIWKLHTKGVHAKGAHDKGAHDKDAHARGPDKKELGFICLFTDGMGNYWFKCSRGFHTSLGESLSSLETLIDELGEEVDVAFKHVVNQTYRRLSDLLE